MTKQTGFGMFRSPFALAAGLLGALAGWGAVRAADGSRAAPPPPCEHAVNGKPALRPNCSEPWRAPGGQAAAMRVNAEGFRESARAYLLRHARRVAVAGGGIVEGEGAAQNQTLPALLSEEAQGAYFVNAGLRGAGLELQLERLREAARLYSARGSLWVLSRRDWGEAGACAAVSGARAKEGSSLLVLALTSGDQAELPACLKDLVSVVDLGLAEPEAAELRRGRLAPDDLALLSARIRPAVSAWLASRR